MKTLANKIMAVSLITLGVVSCVLLKDGTFMIFALLIGTPLFFARRNWTSM